MTVGLPLAVLIALLAVLWITQLRRTVRALVHGRSCYLVPRDDGGLVLGATVEERGSALDVPLGGLADLVDDARRVVPVLDEYSVVELAPGLRPGSPDNGPIVGTTSVTGLVMATGHYRNGVLLAPATAPKLKPGAYPTNDAAVAAAGKSAAPTAAKKAPARAAAKKAPARKATARKAPARKAPARKAPARKAPAKRAPAKRAAKR